MNSSLELDNENLRLKLQELRKANSSLVAENHRLVETLETFGCELRNSSSRIQNLEESVESYRSKSQELNGVLTVFQKASKSGEKDCERLKQKYEECSHQLAESAGLLQSQSDAIESLKMELDELRNLRMKTEAERNLALETAEKLQRSYEELQTNFKKTLSSAEEEAGMLHKERDQLCKDLEGRCSQIKTLQEDVKNLRADVSTQKNARRENEQRNAELRLQMKNQSLKIEKLEQDLENHRKFKVKNGEMKAVMDQHRRRISSLEGEIRGVHAKMSQLEELLQYSKKTSFKKSKNSLQNNGNLASGVTNKTDKNDIRNGAFDIVDLEKFVVVESELLQLRMDVMRLANSFSELSGKDMSGVLNTALQGGASVEWRQMEKLSENRVLDDSVAALAGVEKRLASFESTNARLVSHVAKLNAEISGLQKNGDERTTKQERELQKRMQQIALLEKQLDEKVQEMTSHVFELNSAKVELERSKADCETARAELDAKRQECRLMGSDVKRLKQLHSEHCLELEGQIAIVERERDEMRNRLEQTDSRCRALQQSLSQTIDISDALKDDLQGCRQLETMVLATERKAREATERAAELEEALDSLRTEFADRLEGARVVEEDYRAQVEERNERVRICEERLSRAQEQVRLNEGEITRLLEEANGSQASVRDGAERMEHERTLIRSQVSELQERLKRETSHLKSLLDGSEERLEEALDELEQKDYRIADLTRKVEDARLEQARTKELFSKVEESDKLRMEAEVERMVGISRKRQEENEMLRAMLKEREAAIEDLQGRVVRSYKELQERAKIDKHSFAEVERLKAEAHTRESQLAEAARKAESLEDESKTYREQLESVRVSLAQRTEELQRSRLDLETLNEKLQEREWDLEQKTTMIKRLEQTLTDRLSVLTQSEQNRLRFEGALQKNQLDVEQYEKRVASLEDQLHDLLTLVKEQCIKICKDEDANGQLTAELDARNARIEGLERIAGNANHELKRLMTVNKRAEEEMSASRDHLKKMQNDLIGARQEVTSLRSQHDHLAKDLAEAVDLLQQKDSELSRLLQTLSVAEECRSRYSDRLEESEEALRSLKANYHRDIHQLKDAHEMAIALRENERRSLQQDLVASEAQQQHLAERVQQLAELRMVQREGQRSRSKSGHQMTMEERASSSQESKSGGHALELSHCTSSEASPSDALIFGNLQSLSDSEVANGKAHRSKGDDRRHLPQKGWSTSCVERGMMDQDKEVLNNSDQSCHSSSAVQGWEEDNSLGSNFFQTMWNVLLHSEIDEHAVLGCHPTLCVEQDETRSTICTPTHDYGHAAAEDDRSTPVINGSASVINCHAPGIKDSAINCHTPMINSSASVINSHAPVIRGSTPMINRSAPASNFSTSVVNHSDLIVYHLAPSGKRSASSIDNSNSIQLQNDPSLKSSKSKPQPQKFSKSQTPDIPTEPKQRLHQTPNPKKTDPRSSVKLSKNTPKKATRSQINESPFSPIFANRHSPNPMTAISYYERILPTSKSDAEVEKIIAGRDFYDGERFSSLSDE